jgi:flagellar biosynthesis/type III secretory pathway chaperone
MISTCLDRLEELVDAETTALRNRDLSVISEAFTRKKSQALLELTRLARNTTPDTNSLSRLSRLSAKLDENMNVLGVHLRASKDISATLSDVIAKSQSDGTYDAVSAGGRGFR